jgi:phenylacetate-CoA ligase
MTKGAIIRLLRNFSHLSVNGRRPYKIKSLKDFENLPILDKTALQEINSSIRNCPVKPVIVHTTSGSTNIPLVIYFSKESWKNIIARTIQTYQLANVTKKDIILNLFGYGAFVAGPIYDQAAKKMEFTLLPLGSSNMTDRERLIMIIEKALPTVICGVPSYALEVVKMMEDKKIRLPKKVLCAGEALTKDYRKEFEKRGIKAFDNYGCTEIPAISAETYEEKGWTLLIENGLHIEFISDSGIKLEEGEGRLVITDLHNFSTPIIRYKLGDRVLMKLKNGKRYIKILRRDDNLKKYRGFFVNIDLLCEEARKYSKQYFIILDINKTSMNDEIKIYLPKKVSKKAEKIKEDFKQKYRVKPILVFSGNIPTLKTPSGKVRYFIDKRQ